MPPDDPLGRHGPSLDNFLCCQPWSQEHLPPLCPYGSKKCTYGNKCKYYHPERRNIPQKSVTDKLAEQTPMFDPSEFKGPKFDCNLHVYLCTTTFRVMGLGLWCLTPLSTIFQLYRLTHS
jgi:hypothetical protein